MDQAAFVPVFKFRTIDYPEQDRFHVWVKDMLCDYRLDDDGGHGAFDAEASGAALGPLILSGRQWRSRAPAYRVNRTTRRIRLDGQDSIRFTLLLGGRLASYTGARTGQARRRRVRLRRRAGQRLPGRGRRRDQPGRAEVPAAEPCRTGARPDADERRGAAAGRPHAVAVPQPADSAHARDPEHRAIDVAAAGRGHFTHHAGAARRTRPDRRGAGRADPALHRRASAGSTSIPTGSAATSACRERGSTSCSRKTAA